MDIYSPLFGTSSSLSKVGGGKEPVGAFGICGRGMAPGVRLLAGGDGRVGLVGVSVLVKGGRGGGGLTSLHHDGQLGEGAKGETGLAFGWWRHRP